MLTEPFLNSCFSILLNEKADLKKDRRIIRDIFEILTFHRDKERLEIPINVQNKFECLSKMCKLRLEGRSSNTILDNIVSSNKYSGLSSFLSMKASEKIDDDELGDYVRNVRLRKKATILFSNYDELTRVLESVRDCSFDSMDDLVIEYEENVKRLFLSVMESNRSIEVEAAATLDLMNDDYSTAVKGIIDKYERKNTTPTGYQIFDNDILNGGFEPTRLYLFGGGSGAGKSTLLLNFIMNAATIDKSLLAEISQNVKPKKEGKEDVYLYVTLENTIDESLLRSYMMLFDKKLHDALKDTRQLGHEVIKQRVVDRLNLSGSTVIMKYFRSNSISPYDLMAVVDDVKATYGKDSIRGLYVDYLDKLKPDIKHDLHRLDLANITSTLKTIAVEAAIPVITLTQLGRSIYEGVTDTNQLTMNLVAEAIKKVEDADFVALQAKDVHDIMKIHMRIGKNRGGESEMGILWNVNFSMYKFLAGRRISNKKKASVDNQTGFSGMGNEF